MKTAAIRLPKRRTVSHAVPWHINPSKAVTSDAQCDDLKADLHAALQNKQFEMHYQPKARLTDGKISGMEALLRWRHPERGLVSPVEFIPVAEETGLIVPLGEWVIREVCRQLSEWRSFDAAPPRVAINLSAHQLSSPRLLAVLVASLHEFDLDPSLLELEITETALMVDIEGSAYLLQQLVAIGFNISVDDFGTGYSSLAYLKRFPLDTLKIDRSFIMGIGVNRYDSEITIALIHLAHVLGLKVIAEGVETDEQLSFLREHQCDEIQGYLFSRPLAANDCMTFFGHESRLSGYECSPADKPAMNNCSAIEKPIFAMPGYRPTLVSVGA